MYTRMRIFSFLAFGALSANAADIGAKAPEFELASAFLDAHVLAASDGEHDSAIMDKIDQWTSNKKQQDILKTCAFTFSGLQVLRGTKLVAVISPVALVGGQQFDLRNLPIWQQMVERIRASQHVTMTEYSSEVSVVIQTPTGQQVGVYTSPTFIIMNSNYAKRNEVVKYFATAKRNVNFHPNNDIHFVLEGYLFGYTFNNIQTFYLRADANRKLPFNKVHEAALTLLPNFVERDASELTSAHQKFPRQ